MFFRDIPAKLKEKQYLTTQVDENRIPHAQLMLGKEGYGGLSLALAYVNYILCTDRKNMDSCGVCKSCVQAHKMIHPDLHFAFPVVKKGDEKREDTTSNAYLTQFRSAVMAQPFLTLTDWAQTMGGTGKPNINRKECQEIAGKLGLQSFADGPKILVMWLPEYLGKEGNRLLKLIEEPTDNTHLILVSENQNLILSTILSRCQLVRVEGYQEEAIAEYLQRVKPSLDTDRLNQIARLADGNIAKALKIASGQETDYSQLLIDWLRCAYQGNAITMLDFAIQLSAITLEQQKEFLDYGLFFLREYLFWLNTGITPKLSTNEITVAQNMAKVLTANQVDPLMGVLNHILFALDRNANQKLNFMANTIIIGDVLKNKVNNSLLELTL